MKLSDALKARRYYPNANRHQAAIQAVRYAKALEYLGDKWLLVRKSGKLPELRPV